MMSIQSTPSALPFSQMPPSDSGFSSTAKLVRYDRTARPASLCTAGWSVMLCLLVRVQWRALAGGAGSARCRDLHFEQHVRDDERRDDGRPGRPWCREGVAEYLVPCPEVLGAGQVLQPTAGSGQLLGDPFNDEGCLAREVRGEDGKRRRIKRGRARQKK